MTAPDQPQPVVITEETLPSCSLDSGMLPSQPRELPDSQLLADFTTFHIGGQARHLVVARSETDLIAAVRQADQAGEPLLILSGGSNLLVADEGFPGTVIVVATSGITAEVSTCAGAYLSAQAGETWDHLVALSVERGWSGLEMLSGIPGLVGAAPIQNIGAYGAEVASVIAKVRTFDRQTNRVTTLWPDDCRFGYRTSLFKQSDGRYVVLSVDVQLRLADRSVGLAYAELAHRLGLNLGDRAPIQAVRQAVLDLRRGKGMVVNPADHDSWSAGSFFTNPVISPAQAANLPAEVPRFPQPDGSIKTSAAWLIDQAGFPKGYGSGPATLSTKHVLALTNRGGASAADVLDLAHLVRDGVRDRYGINLEPEPILVGLTW